jgi:hypothetical protein
LPATINTLKNTKNTGGSQILLRGIAAISIIKSAKVGQMGGSGKEKAETWRANISASWLRSQGSNLGPSGYEPDELPLLYFAMQS